MLPAGTEPSILEVKGRSGSTGWARVRGGPRARPQAVSPYGSVLGQRLGPLELRAAWEQSPWCAAPGAEGARRPALCATRSRLISTLRGAALVQRQKDLSAYNWNSFGLRYGRGQAAGGQRPGTSPGDKGLPTPD